MCKLCISDCFVQTDVLGNAPELIDGIGGVLRQNAVLEHQAPAIMDGKCSVLAEHLIVFRHTKPATPCAEWVSWVIVEKGGVIWLDN